MAQIVSVKMSEGKKSSSTNLVVTNGGSYTTFLWMSALNFTQLNPLVCITFKA